MDAIRPRATAYQGLLGLTFTKGLNPRLLELPPDEAVSRVEERQRAGDRISIAAHPEQFW